MKAYSRCCVQEAVQMMHFVKAPEEGDLVIGPMPPVDKKIEQQQICKKAAPATPRFGPPWEKMRGSPGGQGDNDKRREAAVEQPERPIAPQARQAGGLAAIARLQGRRQQPFSNKKAQEPEAEQRDLSTQNKRGIRIHKADSLP